MTIRKVNVMTGAVEVLAEDAPSFVTPKQELARERENMVVSAMQVRLALLAAGRLRGAEAIVAAADTATQIAWDKAVEFRRNSPTIAALALIADPPFSPDDLDTLFRAAMQIEA